MIIMMMIINLYLLNSVCGLRFFQQPLENIPHYISVVLSSHISDISHTINNINTTTAAEWEKNVDSQEKLSAVKNTPNLMDGGEAPASTAEQCCHEAKQGKAPHKAVS